MMELAGSCGPFLVEAFKLYYKKSKSLLQQQDG